MRALSPRKGSVKSFFNFIQIPLSMLCDRILIKHHENHCLMFWIALLTSINWRNPQSGRLAKLSRKRNVLWLLTPKA